MNDILAIHLTGKRGGLAIVDSDVGKDVMLMTWNHSQHGYATAALYHKETQKSSRMYLHRLLYGASKGEYVDHKNGNKLDNRRCNIRICTQTLNNANQSVQKRAKSSRFKGVCYVKGRNKWKAKVKHLGKQYNIGDFKTESEAARAYNTKATEMFGEFAKLNEV